MFELSTCKRIPFVCSAITGNELKGGTRDVTRVYFILTDPELGCCESKGYDPIINCRSRSEFENKLRHYISNWKPYNQFIFYFSGHGEHKRGQYCLKFGENDLYPFKNLLNELQLQGVTKGILIVDACYSGFITGSKGKIDEQISIPEGMAYLSSSSYFEESQELADGSSSVFTSLFCEGISEGLNGIKTKDNLIRIDDIYEYIYNRLDKDSQFSSYTQRPKFKIENSNSGIWISKNRSTETIQQSISQSLFEEEPSFIGNDTHVNYDRRIIRSHCIDDLDKVLLDFLLDQPLAKSVLAQKEILHARHNQHLELLGLSKKNNPTIGTFLCLGSRKYLVDKFGSCSLNMVTYNGETRGNSDAIIESASDNLINLFEIGMNFLARNSGLKRLGLIGTTKRDDLEIPEIALREALANALVHRNYEDPDLKDQPTRIEVYTNRVEITSFGNLLSGISQENLNINPEKIIPKRRNYIVSEIFRIFQKVELNASGISRMHMTMKKAGLPVPSIEGSQQTSSVKVIFSRPSTPIDNTVPKRVESIPNNLPRSGAVSFVGRDDLIARIDDQLNSNSRLSITGIRGMGGIGKTELALQYAICKQHNYSGGVCWLQTRDQQISNQIISFAKENLGIQPPDELEVDAQVRFIWQRWPPENSLIILDDVTDYDAIASYLPPSDPRFKVLITTRINLGSSVTSIEIEELTDESAIALLKSIVGVDRIESQRADAVELCAWVGNLPLGLELLGRFLARKPDWAIAKLLKRLESRRLDVQALVSGESGMTASLGVAAALELSWAELNNDERDLGCLLGMFAIAPIPWNLVKQCYEEKDSDDLEDWRDGLRDRSLIKRVNEYTYQLHQIVKEFFREKLSLRNIDTNSIQSAFFKMMVKQAQSLEKTPTLKQIERVRTAIVHLEEVVSSWINYLEDDEKIWPYVGISQFYKGLGYYDLAELWHVKCLYDLKELLNNDHPAIASSLNYLAELYSTQGRYEEALPLAKQSLEIINKVFGNKNPEIAFALNSLAALYENQGRYEKAETLYIQALELRQKLLGNEHPDVALSLNNLAGLYSHQGRYEEAKPLLLRALELRKNLLGNEHPDIALTLNNLAVLYENQGRYEKAKPLLLRALELRQKLLGNEHPDVATSLNNLAVLYSKQGRYVEAKPLYLKVLELRKKLLEANHPDVAESYFTLGTFYYQQDQKQKAKSLYFAALQIYNQRLGANHPTTQAVMKSLEKIPSGTEALPLEELGLFLSGNDSSQTIQIRQTVRGDRNQVVGQAINSTVLNVSGGSVTIDSKSNQPSHQSIAQVKTILVLAANPKGTNPLRIGEEVRFIQSGLERSQYRDRFRLEQRWAVTATDVRRALLDIQPEYVHFSGQGQGTDSSENTDMPRDIGVDPGDRNSPEGLVFEDQTGQPHLVSTEAIANLFSLFSDQIECVVLNACYSATQADAIAEHIPHVVGMKRAIGDRAAIEFAIGFYDALLAGRDVDFAFKLGRSSIQMEGIPEHLTPILKHKTS